VKNVTCGGSGAHFAREFAPLFVPATQNPIEQEGTCPLPEIQQDRFMFSLIIGYQPKDQELAVVIATTGAAAWAVLRQRIVTNFRAESEGWTPSRSSGV
jgi:MoxR-like ATPase